MYAFQKSHSVCYTWLAYQMAYLKANHPEEFYQVMNQYASYLDVSPIFANLI